jgi:AraC-like DNA-binding protein
MNLEFRKPPSELEPFVRRMVISDYDVTNEIVFHPWPTGNIYLVLFFGELTNYSVSVNGRERRFVSPAWLAGQLEYHQVRVAIRGRTSTIVVEFTPQSFWRLFGRPGRWLTGRTCDPADIGCAVGDAAASRFASLPGTADECMPLLIEFLAGFARSARPEDVMLAEALSLLHAQHGCISVAEVAQKVAVSPRHLNRRFHKIVGLAPKFYGRVLQINQVLEMLWMPGKASIADVASEGGFYDQAHLNRAMNLFFSEGPTAFLKGDHLLFRTFLEQHVPKSGRASSGSPKSF